VLHGNGELVGGNEGQGGGIGQSDWLLSSQYNHRYRDIRDLGDLSAGHEAISEIQSTGWIAQRKFGLAKCAGKLHSSFVIKIKCHVNKHPE
jgi:hypothetical protein